MFMEQVFNDTTMLRRKKKLFAVKIGQLVLCYSFYLPDCLMLLAKTSIR